MIVNIQRKNVAQRVAQREAQREAQRGVILVIAKSCIYKPDRSPIYHTLVICIQ